VLSGASSPFNRSRLTPDFYALHYNTIPCAVYDEDEFGWKTSILQGRSRRSGQSGHGLTTFSAAIFLLPGVFFAF